MLPTIIFAQSQGNGYGCWSEPLFDDNVADFEASPGCFEFSLNAGATPEALGWTPDLGWEAEVSATNRLGFEMGFYSTFSSSDKLHKTEAIATRTAISFQYTLHSSFQNAWATGADFYSPGWSRYYHDESPGWGVRPFLIYGKRKRGGFNSQWRISPGVELGADGLQWNLAFQNSIFWEKDHFCVGWETGAAIDGAPLAFGAPQVGIYFSNYSLFAGWWQSWYFNKNTGAGWLLLSLAYNWEKEGV
jgi:hypothetical protein